MDDLKPNLEEQGSKLHHPHSLLNLESVALITFQLSAAAPRLEKKTEKKEGPLHTISLNNFSLGQETEANKEFVVFIVDSSPSMLEPGVLNQVNSSNRRFDRLGSLPFNSGCLRWTCAMVLWCRPFARLRLSLFRALAI